MQAVAALAGFGKFGAWMDQHGAELSIQCMIGTWHVTVSWSEMISYSDSRGRHRKTWDVSRHDSDLMKAIGSALEEALSQTGAIGG